MPALSLADFASLVTADAEEHPAAGILHLVAGVRQVCRIVSTCSRYGNASSIDPACGVRWLLLGVV